MNHFFFPFPGRFASILRTSSGLMAKIASTAWYNADMLIKMKMIVLPALSPWMAVAVALALAIVVTMIVLAIRRGRR